MRKGSRNIETATHDGDVGHFTTKSTYLLPLSAHAALIHTRDELRLLSQLAEPRSEDDRDEIVLSTEALSDCFNRIAEQLSEVLLNFQKVGLGAAPRDRGSDG